MFYLMPEELHHLIMLRKQVVNITILKYGVLPSVRGAPHTSVVFARELLHEQLLQLRKPNKLRPKYNLSLSSPHQLTWSPVTSYALTRITMQWQQHSITTKQNM